MSTDPDIQRCGFIAVVGLPNAGKSTLINALVGNKVSIVSPKAQTTRTRILGIAIYNNAQIIFVDTPGIHDGSKKQKLERAMVNAAITSLEDADHILLVVDASRKDPYGLHQNLINRIKNSGKTCSLVLNKIDQMRADDLLPLSQKLNEAFPFHATFMISALKKDGCESILQNLENAIPQTFWHYPEDQVSDMPLRLLASEITREKLFHAMHDEIPYRLTVETEEWENFDNGSIKINQIIYVVSDSHKKIILGKSGDMIKRIGQQSRLELQEIMETDVHLKLFVKVRENWMDDPERLQVWGLET